MRQPCPIGGFAFIGRCEPTLAQCGEARVRRALAAIGGPVNGKLVVAHNRDLAAQAIERQALDQLIGSIGFAIEQQIFAISPDDEVE